MSMQHAREQQGNFRGTGIDGKYRAQFVCGLEGGFFCGRIIKARGFAYLVPEAGNALSLPRGQWSGLACSGLLPFTDNQAEFPGIEGK